MLQKNPDAIKAAQVLSRGIVTNVDDYVDSVTHRNGLYETVKAEHDRQVAAIHLPSEINRRALPLNAKQKLFLWYIDGKRPDCLNIGVYWYIEYSIYDYQACIQHLFDGGYLTTAEPADSLFQLQAADLKSILKHAGLPTSGAKAALCKRIQDCISPESINAQYPEYKTFTCTASGKEIIERSSAIVYYHQHRMKTDVHLSLREIDKAATKRRNIGGAALVWLLSYKKDRKSILQKVNQLDENTKQHILKYANERMRNGGHT